MSLHLPKFEISCDRTCNGDLAALGLIEAFDDTHANFSKISKSNDLFISLVKHKAKIEVNEKGTVAAAVTVVIVDEKDDCDDMDFEIDKISVLFNYKFWFYLYDMKNKNVLFFGKCTKPKFEKKNNN